MTSKIIYTGGFRTELTHIQSGSIIENDAPTDNFGKGERFSPTDMLASSLGTCIITTMAIRAKDLNINFEGTTIDVTKVMSKDAPRRVAEIILVFHFTQNFNATDEQKAMLERIAHHCPVGLSLHPDVKIDCTFNW